MSHERKFSRRDFAKLFGVGGLLFLASCAPKIPLKETASPTLKNTETPTLLPSKSPTLTKTSTLTVTRTEAVPTKEDERKIPPPKMMVLGDSITKFGFADYLSEALNEEGYQVEFVGSNISNKNVKNEGHGGFSTIEIERDLEDGFWSWGGTETPTHLDENIPNILVLELGTNDAASGLNPEKITIPNFRKIVTIFRSKKPEVKIIIFPVIPSALEWDRMVKKINKLFLDLTRELYTEKSPVFLAPDVRSDNFDTDKDLVDGVHPSASGYQKMVKSCMVVLEKMISRKN